MRGCRRLAGVACWRTHACALRSARRHHFGVQFDFCVMLSKKPRNVTLPRISEGLWSRSPRLSTGSPCKNRRSKGTLGFRGVCPASHFSVFLAARTSMARCAGWARGQAQGAGARSGLLVILSVASLRASGVEGSRRWQRLAATEGPPRSGCARLSPGASIRPEKASELRKSGGQGSMGRCAHRPVRLWFALLRVRLTKPPQIAKMPG